MGKWFQCPIHRTRYGIDKCGMCEQEENQMEKKMTREEYIKKYQEIMYSDHVHSDKQARRWSELAIDTYQALGLIKFEEEKNKEVVKLFEFADNNCTWCKDYSAVSEKYGTIRLEKWPEGLVLSVGRRIVWKSWEKQAKIGDDVTITATANGLLYSGKLEIVNKQ